MGLLPAESISSQARYDHFDTSPCVYAAFMNLSKFQIRNLPPPGDLSKASETGQPPPLPIMPYSIRACKSFPVFFGETAEPFPPHPSRRNGQEGRRTSIRRPCKRSSGRLGYQKITARTPPHRQSWSDPPAAGRCPWGRSSGYCQRERSYPPASPLPGCP